MRTSAREAKDEGHGQGENNGEEQKKAALEGKKNPQRTKKVYHCSRDYCSNSLKTITVPMNSIKGKIITLGS